jgi:hypothetical protein
LFLVFAAVGTSAQCSRSPAEKKESRGTLEVAAPRPEFAKQSIQCPQSKTIAATEKLKPRKIFFTPALRDANFPENRWHFLIAN